MSSTYSPDLRIELIGNGEQAGNWGSTTNTNLGTLIEGAIAGYTSVSVTSANQAFTVNNGAEDQARMAMLALTTTTVAAFAVYAPPVSKQYIIYNTTAYTATIYNSTVSGNTTAAGTGVAIPANKKVQVFTNGTNFLAVDAASLSATLPIASGGTGQTTATAAFNALAPVQQTGATVNAGSFVVGNTYSILVVGTTSFTAIGASANTIGVIFTATGVGSGSGSATNIATVGQYLASNGTNAFWTNLQFGSTATVSAGSFVIGNTYTIYELANAGAQTDFTAIGASANTPGVVFVATGVGAGTGTAYTSTNGNGTVLLSSGSVGATLTTATLTTPTINGAMMEKATITATVPPSTTNYDASTQTVQFYTTNATANFTLNIRGTSTVSLNTLMATGQAMTLALLVNCGTTAYYPNVIQIDGTTITPKWQNGTAITAGLASAVNVYVFTVIKTASATYTVLGSQTKFA
jgi:hypothetical protein